MPTGAPILERYEAAVRLLASCISIPGREDIEAAEGIFPSYPQFRSRCDDDRSRASVRLVCSADAWSSHLDLDQKAEFVAAWDKVFSQLSNTEKSLLLRDVHSPNILWRESETGINRVGLIDFQDAMIGPSAYDVASLIFDARVTIAPDIQDHLLGAYIDERRSADPGFR